jgi:hypothetical protein
VDLLLAQLLQPVDGGAAAVGVLGLPCVEQEVVVPGVGLVNLYFARKNTRGNFVYKEPIPRPLNSKTLILALEYNGSISTLQKEIFLF